MYIEKHQGGNECIINFLKNFNIISHNIFKIIKNKNKIVNIIAIKTIFKIKMSINVPINKEGDLFINNYFIIMFDVI